MSSQRIAGLALLIAVGLAVVVFGASRGHWRGGQAVADWPPPPPVGSCVGVPGGDVLRWRV